MINSLMFLFNPYDRHARLYPALLTIFPIFASFFILITDFSLKWTTVGVLALSCGVTVFLTHIGRDRGKRLEPGLFVSWGGKPSVAMLRHSDTRLGKVTKERYRRFLEDVVPGIKLASEEEERAYSEQADDGYESATDWLIAQTRDRQRFDLLFWENMNYGFRRNIWALKPCAFAVDGIVAIVVAALVFNFWIGDTAGTIQAISLEIWVCISVVTLHTLAFAFWVTKDWIRVAAEAYAQNLLAACDILREDIKR